MAGWNNLLAFACIVNIYNVQLLSFWGIKNPSRDRPGVIVLILLTKKNCY